MPDQAIIVKTADGVSVIHPVESIERALLDVPKGAEHYVVNKSEIPSDRYFRAAWEFDGPKGPKVNIEKAKEIQRNKWRKMRAPKLAALDVEFMQALESSNPARSNQIKEQKTALRDVTITPLHDDLEAIKNTIPQILL